MAFDVRVYNRWSGIIGSIALGAVAMYAFDPDKGRRRRAVARDKAYALMLDTRHVAGATTRDVAHRLDGLHARVRRLWTQAPTADDLQVIERVRARMGRAVSHPHAIQVGALQGRVTLSGPVLAHEVVPLVAAVRSVWGVRHVENMLVVHEHPDSVPSLQGASGAHDTQRRDRWPPALRAAALCAGVLVALAGARRRSVAGSLVAAGGVLLALGGVTNFTLPENAISATDVGTHAETPGAEDAPERTDVRNGFDDAANRWRSLH